MKLLPRTVCIANGELTFSTKFWKVSQRRMQFVNYCGLVPPCVPIATCLVLHNCNCNWVTCIAPPPTRRPRAHHRVKPYPYNLRSKKKNCRVICKVQISERRWTSPMCHASLSPYSPATKSPSLLRGSHDSTSVSRRHYCVMLIRHSCDAARVSCCS